MTMKSENGKSQMEEKQSYLQVVKGLDGWNAVHSNQSRM